MLTFKTITDISKLPATDPAQAVIQNILADFPRDADRDGYIILVEPGDTEINLPELKLPIADMQWDGIWKQDGHYHAVYLTNNEFAIEFVVPDSDWLDPALRKCLEEQAQMSPPYMKEAPF